MKISIERTTLINALDITSKAVTQKSPVPMLEGIHINAANGVVKFRGFSNEMTIESTAKCDVLQSGEVIANARLFYEAIRKMPECEVILTVEGKAMTIESGIANMKISILSGESFPEFPSIDTYKSFEIDTQTLRGLVENVSFATLPANDDKSPTQILKSICFDVENEKINAVGVDGYRMAIATQPMNSKDMRVLIPAKQLESILKSLKGNMLNISTDGKMVLIQDGTSKAFINLLNGEFIAYKRFFTVNSNTHVRVKISAMLSVLERALLLFDIDEGARLIISIKNDKMNIGYKGRQGEIDEIVPSKVDGDDIEIGFNPRLLVEGFKHIEDDEVIMNFTSSTGPVTLTPVKGDDFYHFVLPVRKRCG